MIPAAFEFAMMLLTQGRALVPLGIGIFEAGLFAGFSGGSLIHRGIGYSSAVFLASGSRQSLLSSHSSTISEDQVVARRNNRFIQVGYRRVRSR